MEEAGGGEDRFSPSWLRDELRQLRRLQRRRFYSDPLLARLPPGNASPAARRSVLLLRSRPKGERLLGTTATHERRKERPGVCSSLSFWKRIAGIVIVVAVILLLTWVTLYPPKIHLEPCPDDWLYYKKKCYYHSADMADWNSSQEFCSDYGASLAVIDSHQELNFIMHRIRITNFWIGLRREGNKFFWVNGESFDTNLFHVNITNNGDCVHIDSAFISTRSCSSLRNRLCTIGQFQPKTSS
ncbi:C-type lectin domain family 2 member E-like [Phoenicopterus ruber ruber]